MRLSFIHAYYVLWLTAICMTCQQPEPLPILGPYEKINHQKHIRPIDHFSLINQQKDSVGVYSFNHQIKVVDFFFTSCPSICPIIQAQMLRIRESFPEDTSLILISHTIDPKRDTPERLSHYAKSIGADIKSWQFLTGDRNELYRLADEYFNIVVEDESAPGGFDHTGRIVLLDEAGYIRAYANGLVPTEVDTLILSIQQLLNQ